MADAVKVRGVEVVLGDRTLIMPPLNFKQVRELNPKIQAMIKLDAMEALGTVVEVIGAALRRNYPDITDAWLEDAVDLGNHKDLFDVVMGISTYPKTGPGAGKAAAANSTGTESTVT